MVQTVNLTRLNQLIKFGAESDQPKYDPNDNPIPSIDVAWMTLGAHWSLTTTQMLQREGNNSNSDLIFAVHHRSFEFWQDIDRAILKDQTYEVTYVNQDAENAPRSCDLVTLKAVNEHE